MERRKLDKLLTEACFEQRIFFDISSGYFWLSIQKTNKAMFPGTLFRLLGRKNISFYQQPSLTLKIL